MTATTNTPPANNTPVAVPPPASPTKVATPHGDFRPNSVLLAIYQMLALPADKALTKEQMWTHLCELFPLHPNKEGMKTTINCQLNRMGTERGFEIGRDEAGRYSMHIQGRSAVRMLGTTTTARHAGAAEKREVKVAIRDAKNKLASMKSQRKPLVRALDKANKGLGAATVILDVMDKALADAKTEPEKVAAKSKSEQAQTTFDTAKNTVDGATQAIAAKDADIAAQQKIISDLETKLTALKTAAPVATTPPAPVVGVNQDSAEAAHQEVDKALAASDDARKVADSVAALEEKATEELARLDKEKADAAAATLAAAQAVGAPAKPGKPTKPSQAAAKTTTKKKK